MNRGPGMYTLGLAVRRDHVATLASHVNPDSSLGRVLTDKLHEKIPQNHNFGDSAAREADQTGDAGKPGAGSKSFCQRVLKL